MEDQISLKSPCNKKEKVDAEDEKREGKKITNQGCKRQYIQIDIEKRKELLEELEKNNTTIKNAAEKLNINYSTAKNIVNVYRREKRIHTLPKRNSCNFKTNENGGHIPQSGMMSFYNAEEAEQMMSEYGKKKPRLEEKSEARQFDLPASQIGTLTKDPERQSNGGHMSGLNSQINKPDPNLWKRPNNDQGEVQPQFHFDLYTSNIESRLVYALTL